MKTYQPGVWTIIILFLLLLVSINCQASNLFIPNFDDNTVTVIDADDQTAIKTIDVGINPNGVAWNSSATTVYVTNRGSHEVSVIHAKSMQVVTTIPVGNGPLGIVTAADDAYIYVGNVTDGTVNIINAETYVVEDTIDVGLFPIGLALSDNGRYLFTASVAEASVSMIDLNKRKVVDTIPVGKQPHGVTVFKDTLLVTNAEDETVSIINLKDRSSDFVPVQKWPVGVAFHPEGDTAYVANRDSGTVSVIHLPSKQVKHIPVGQGSVGLTLSPEADWLYTANMFDSTVSVVNLHALMTVNTVVVGQSPIGLGFMLGGHQAIRGVVNQLRPRSVFCENKTTRKRVKIKLKKDDYPRTSWNCVKHGLAVNRGDKLEIHIKGRAGS